MAPQATTIEGQKTSRMSRWVFFVALAVGIANTGLVQILPEPWGFLLLLALLPAAVMWWRYLRLQTQEHTFSRTFQAAPQAAYSALCGALMDLEYTITTRDPGQRAVQFNGGRLGPWIGRFGVVGNAFVREITSRESEIVLAGHIDLDDKVGAGLATYPEGMALRAKKLFDRVEGTVVTYAMTDAGS
jgi:hypothetical protein